MDPIHFGVIMVVNLAIGFVTPPILSLIHIYTVVTGPGKIVLQTMPFSSFAGALAPFFASGGK